MSKEKQKHVVDVVRVEGWVEVIVKDKHDKIKYYIATCPEKLLKNIITDVALPCIIRLIFYGLTEDKFRYLAIGTGLTGEEKDDEALEAEVKRKTATITQTTTTITGDTALLEATFSSADGLSGTVNLSEVGILNLPSGGDLFARKVYPAVPLYWDDGETITPRYYIQMTRLG